MLADVFLPKSVFPSTDKKLRIYKIIEVYACTWVCMHFPGSSLRFGAQGIGFSHTHLLKTVALVGRALCTQPRQQLP